jgi:carbonic anhydrase
MPTVSRRHVVRTALGGALAAMISAVGTELAGSRSASAQSTMSPDDALKALMDGNQRFVERRLTSFQEDIDILMQHTAEKQEPFASVLACADSRVPVEIVFDQSIGHVFVNRVAGNIATSEIIASVKYGAAAHASRPGLRRVGLNLRPAVILAGTYRDHVRPVAVEKLSISIVQN